jgi:hypothetical protein
LDAKKLSETVRAESRKLQEDIRAEVHATLGEALQGLDRQIAAAPVLAVPSGNSVLTDQARTKQELEQIQQWGEQQQRCIQDLSGRTSDIPNNITTESLPPAAGAAESKP